MRMFKLFLLVIVALSFFSCSSTAPKVEGKTEAETLYKESLQLIDGSRFLLATEKLNSLKSQYPYSYYATHAELLLADILFKQENFVEAGVSYILFRDFHPHYKEMSYVVWMIGESFFKQMPSSFDRDLSSARESIKYYGELILNYPNYEKIDLAKKRIEKAKWMLLQREKYIADFYYKTSVFKAARYRYLDILDNFKDEQLKIHAMLRIVKSSYKLAEYKKCLNYGDLYKDHLEGKQKEALLSIVKSCQVKI